jgi:hypothetical protein
MRLRAAIPAAALLLGGCLTVPSGIVDNFVPPQGQTVVTEVKTPLCEQSAPNANDDTDKSIAPCAAEVVTVALAPPAKLVPSGHQRNRPRPPRLPGRR